VWFEYIDLREVRVYLQGGILDRESMKWRGKVMACLWVRVVFDNGS
jgi:hypothetical protein